MDYIDLYCERLGPGVWAEPLNALTNLSFFLAAYFAWKLARWENALDGSSGLLIFMVAVIGSGSTLFHTLATSWAMLSDSLPILFYQILYILFYALRVMKLNIMKASALLAFYFFLTYVFGSIPEAWLNGSLGYLPAILFLAGLGTWHMRHAVQEKNILLLASAVFLVSFTFRSVDMAVCETLPTGLHFLWHILNGVVLYLTLRAYIRNA